MMSALVHIRRAVLTALLISFYCLSASAADNTSEEKYTADDVFILDDVEVRERFREKNVSGKTEITREYIDLLPKGNGNITDLLRMAPSVQFDESYRSSLTAGEIKPEELSISGGKPYQNLYMVDGMNNSSILDPAGDSIYRVNDVGGHAQKFFIDSSIVEKITLFDSNVPASYGGFLGGAVDVRTRMPAKEFGGKISYRTTRSEWTELHVDPDNRERFESSSNSKNQPKFEKHFYTATLDVPVTDNTGFLLSYSRNESTIPLRSFGRWENDYRRSENFFIKGVHNIDGSSYLEVLASYTPYEAETFLANTRNSRYTVNSGGYSGVLNYVREKNDSKLTLHFDISASENSKEANDIYKAWVASGSKPWGYTVDSESGSGESFSREGGYGSIDKTEEAATFKIDHTVGKFKLAGLHSLSYGASVTRSGGTFDRANDGIVYNGAVLNADVICGGSTDTCVDGEQYFSKREITPATYVEAELNEYSFYIEDDYSVGRFGLRAGLRFSYDDYMENFDIAPRLKASYDIFGDKKTVVFTGFNRYYGTTLLLNKLRAGRTPSYTEFRTTYQNQLVDWMATTDASYIKYNYADLKTPYTDEYSVGADQELFGGLLSLQYIERHGKDDFATTKTDAQADGYFHYYLNNNGESTYRSVQLKWNRAWKNHSVMFNAMWQESETSNDSYNDEYDLEDLEKLIVYNGKIIQVKDKPKDNFNRPIVFNIAYTGTFFERLIISPVFNFRGAYRQIVLVDDNYPVEHTGEYDPGSGEPIYNYADKYEEKKRDVSYTLDCSVAWVQPLKGKQKVTFNVEVYNVFDTKNKIGKSDESSGTATEYELGRQFWAGVAYEF